MPLKCPPGCRQRRVCVQARFIIQQVGEGSCVIMSGKDNEAPGCYGAILPSLFLGVALLGECLR